MVQEGQPSDGGGECSLRLSGEHTLIYRGHPVDGRINFMGEIDKIGLHRWGWEVLPHAPIMGNPEYCQLILYGKSIN